MYNSRYVPAILNAAQYNPLTGTFGWKKEANKGTGLFINNKPYSKGIIAWMILNNEIPNHQVMLLDPSRGYVKGNMVDPKTYYKLKNESSTKLAKSSGPQYKGVYKNSVNGSYTARIFMRGFIHSIGTYRDAYSGHIAYQFSKYKGMPVKFDKGVHNGVLTIEEAEIILKAKGII